VLKSRHATTNDMVIYQKKNEDDRKKLVKRIELMVVVSFQLKKWGRLPFYFSECGRERKKKLFGR
jgi:hypothetical protein